MISSTLLTLTTISQTTIQNKDSVTCLKNSQLRSVIKDLEKGKICSQEVVLLNNSIDILNSRLQNKDLIISELKSKSNLQDSIIAVYKTNELGYEKTISNDKKIIKIYRNKLAWNKGAKWIFALAGFVGGLLIVK